MITKSNPPRLPDNLGRVFWITGLAGSGKSTIAKQLALELRVRGEKIIYLDGDSVRETLAENLGHSVNERLRLARSYGRFCKSAETIEREERFGGPASGSEQDRFLEGLDPSAGPLRRSDNSPLRFFWLCRRGPLVA